MLGWLRRLRHRVHHRRTGKRRLDQEVPLGDPPNGLPGQDLLAPGASPSSEVAAAERDARLAQALARLPEQYRQVVTWRNYERLSFAEIGRRTGRTAEAARKLWGRALVRLQQLLEPADE